MSRLFERTERPALDRGRRRWLLAALVVLVAGVVALWISIAASSGYESLFTDCKQVTGSPAEPGREMPAAFAGAASMLLYAVLVIVMWTRGRPPTRWTVLAVALLLVAIVGVLTSLLAISAAFDDLHQGRPPGCDL